MKRKTSEVYETTATSSHVGVWMIWSKSLPTSPWDEIRFFTKEEAWAHLVDKLRKFGRRESDSHLFEPRLTNITYEAVRRRPKPMKAA